MKKLLWLPLLFLIALLMSSCGGGKCNSAPADTFSVSIDSFANGATNISRTPSIQIKFNQAVLNVNTTTVSLYEEETSSKLKEIGSPIPITDITAGSNNSYTFSPLAPLASNTRYVIALSNGITTLTGIALTPTILNFTTGDSITPTVSMITPANNATNASLSQIIQLQFSESVTNVDTTSITLHESSTTGTDVALGNITAGANNSYSFSATSPLLPSNTYYVVLSNAITDVAGNPLTATSFSFTTNAGGGGSDTTAPTVVMTTPTNNATNSSLSQIIQLQFSESVTNVDTTSITLHAGSTTGAAVALGNITAGSNNSYSFSATSPLSSSTTYYVVLSNAISDIAGNNQLSATSFSFTTGDFIAPTVSMVTPTNNAESVSITPSITLQFSESVINVDTTSITLHESSTTGIAVALGNITAESNNSYSFSATSPLSPLTTYYVVLSNAITDIAGNPLSATSFSFTTNLPAWGDVGTAGFSAGAASYTSLAIASDGTPYVAYADAGNSNKATVMKFDGNNWVTVGSAGFSAGAESYTSLAIAPNGTPYVAYRDAGNSNKATVMKFDGNNWVTVGSAGFSASTANYTSLAITPNGTPYVAYQDGSNGKATVMQFNGTSWVNVGNAGFSEGFVFSMSLAIAPNGTPYVAYRDFAKSNKATVMKFDGASWVTVGIAGFSSIPVSPSLAIAPDGTPYVACQASGSKVGVMMFNGTNWVNVGSAGGVSAGITSYASLAIAFDGTPYLAYQDAANGFKATLIMFDGTNWVDVGNAGFSAGRADYTSLAINSSGTPYVAYVDAANADKATVMSYQ
jgi:methionine-rich copper-binding protein CopC